MQFRPPTLVTWHRNAIFVLSQKYFCCEKCIIYAKAKGKMYLEIVGNGFLIKKKMSGPNELSLCQQKGKAYTQPQKWRKKY